MSAAAELDPTFLAITGPTACGKTQLSLAVAGRLGGEIISMDSRQVYRGMDVGTAKVGPAERTLVPHHGLDLVTPDQRYSAGQFARDARRWIEEIHARGRVPILVGGTGFFLRGLLRPMFAEPVLDEGRRDALRTYLRAQPTERLARWVRRLDPARADVAVQGGRQRMSRTLEVPMLTGRTLTEWHRRAPSRDRPLEGVVVRLELDRGEMDRRIRERVRSMIEGGFVQEVDRLIRLGYSSDAPGMSATGYPEIARHLLGETSLEQAVDEVERKTRQYARRQLTWLRNQLPEGTTPVDATAPMDQKVETTLEAWRLGGGSVAGPPRDQQGERIE